MSLARPGCRPAPAALAWPTRCAGSAPAPPPGALCSVSALPRAPWAGPLERRSVRRCGSPGRGLCPPWTAWRRRDVGGRAGRESRQIWVLRAPGFPSSRGTGRGQSGRGGGVGGAEDRAAPPRIRAPAFGAVGPSTHPLSYVSAPIYTSLYFQTTQEYRIHSTVAKLENSGQPALLESHTSKPTTC